jgi:hypothetical protein
VVFFTKGKVVSMGDLYFSGMYPIFHPEHDGSLDGYVQNIKKVLELIPEDSKIVPGHGPLNNKSELRKYHQMIVASITTVDQLTSALLLNSPIFREETNMRSTFQTFYDTYLFSGKSPAEALKEVLDISEKSNLWAAYNDFIKSVGKRHPEYFRSAEMKGSEVEAEVVRKIQLIDQQTP